jgi:hypothetical protein
MADAMNEHALEEKMDSATPRAPRLWALTVEFDSVQSLLGAAEQVRDAGYTRWDCHTPFPVHGLNDAMGIKHTRLPLLVLGGGLTGMSLGLLMQWWMNAKNYPIIVGGKPLFGLPASIPVVFELTILFSALSAFIGMIAFNNLPMWHHNIFKSRRYPRVTSDRFLVVIEAQDPRFEERKTSEFLRTLGGSDVERVEV